MSPDDLRTALLDLLYETRDGDLRLIIGGGYGIYLKREHQRAAGARTLLSEWPEARSTNDLDIFLRPELLIASTSLRPLRKALAALGYDVVETAQKFQFAKPGPWENSAKGLKVDLLTGPQSRFSGTAAKADSRRVRPNPSADLHAHPVDEAVTLEEGLLAIAVDGATSRGVSHRAVVYLPHPFTYAMMKLFAFRDRSDDPDKDFGRYHALDLYAVLAMATEHEWEESVAWSHERQREAAVKEAAQIVHDSFFSPTSLGMLRLKESPYCRPELQLEALAELFPM